MGRIYAATNIHNQKTYIGQETGCLFSRRQQHIYLARNGSQLAFHRAIRKYGEDAFEWRILCDNIPNCDLDATEKSFIKEFRSFGTHGYNMTLGGEGTAKYTDDQLIEISMQYSCPSEWQKHDKKTYLAACKRHLLPMCHTHKHRKNITWSLNEVLLVARKYTNVSSWARRGRSSYDAALYHGWLELCKEHMMPLKKDAYTLDEIRAIASDYAFRSEFNAANPSAYNAARLIDGLLEQLFPDLKDRKVNKHGRILCISTGEIFESAVEASRAKAIDLSSLCKHLKGKIKSIKGLEFRAADV